MFRLSIQLSISGSDRNRMRCVFSWNWLFLCWDKGQDFFLSQSRGNQSARGTVLSLCAQIEGLHHSYLPPRQSFKKGENGQVCAGNAVSVAPGDVCRLQRSSGPVRRHPHRKNLRAGEMCARSQSGGLRQVPLHWDVSWREEVRLKVGSYLFLGLGRAACCVDVLHSANNVRDA